MALPGPPRARAPCSIRTPAAKGSPQLPAKPRAPARQGCGRSSLGSTRPRDAQPPIPKGHGRTGGESSDLPGQNLGREEGGESSKPPEPHSPRCSLLTAEPRACKPTPPSPPLPPAPAGRQSWVSAAGGSEPVLPKPPGPRPEGRGQTDTVTQLPSLAQLRPPCPARTGRFTQQRINRKLLQH